ncbi:MAG TPA: GNAT family N-acetyltransferase [Acidimicrobiales bacterium]|nr:GNAT family N-acetyltransferase [Acidimicrobiales bacterium]
MALSDRPPGATRRVELPGARVLLIRPMHTEDAPGLVSLFASLDDDDVYCRFFSGHPPPESFVERMARVDERGGFGLVAVLDAPGQESRLVGEASCELLPDGNGELGITVAGGARGWLGPFLLDALVEEAAARGIAGIEADVLVLNRRMLSLLRSRGFAVLEHSDQPAIVRVVIATTGRAPAWPGPHDRPRLLLEVPGGRSSVLDAAREAGFQVLACPGPGDRWSHCPALRGEPCPLVTGADLVVDTLPDDPERSLLEAHRRLHPSIPVCVRLPRAGDADSLGRHLSVPAGDDTVIGLLQRLAGVDPATGRLQRPGR